MASFSWQPGPGDTEAADEVGAVAVIPEDRAAFDPAHHDVVQDHRRVQAWPRGMREPSPIAGRAVKEKVYYVYRLPFPSSPSRP